MRLLKFVLLGAVAFAGVLLAGEESRGDAKVALADGLYAEFTTPHGSIVAELFASQVPMTVANFVGLTEGTLSPRQGQPYYTSLKWYRVVPGFVIQSGNPNQPAAGDTGYTFPDEFVPGLRHDQAGILSMANAGPDTNNGEFFLTLSAQTRLNYLHSVFGRVVRGAELLSQIKQDENFSIKILRVGLAAKAFQADENTFKNLRRRAKPYRGKNEPGAAALFADGDHLLPTEPPRAQSFNYKLNNFERATGVKIVARLFAQAPSAVEDATSGAFMHALAEKLGVARRGALAAYFASDDDWRIWIGDESTSAFLGRTATPADLVEDGALHQAKELFLHDAHAAGDAAFVAQQKAAVTEKPAPDNQRLKLQTDAVLDGLIFKLESSGDFPRR